MAVAALAIALVLATGCGAAHRALDERIPPALLAGMRSIGPGPRFHPAAARRFPGPCRRRLGRRTQTHVELFARDHVVLIAAGVGARPPRGRRAGRIVHARCFGPVVTLDPTGTVLVTAGRRATIGDLFRAWGQPLSRTRLASFRAARWAHVAAYVNGRPTPRPPGSIPLAPGAEIVLELGPHVPPHRSYAFPPLPPTTLG
jgi:hypothetical protein